MDRSSVRRLPVSSISRRSALAVLAAGLFLTAVTAGAAEFAIHTSTDIPGLDISSPGNPRNVPLADDEAEVSFCQRSCDLDPRCMAFTWVRRNIQGPTGKCWHKSSSRLLENHGLGLMAFNPDTVSGVKVFQGRACWARHFSNLKFCNVFTAGASGDFTALECPPGSQPASLSNRAIPGRFDRFCVVRLASDPGGLPNCTDAFGGESHEEGVIGNSVNHACLDAN